MARVYLVKYNGQNIWIPESGDCEDGDAAAAKVTGCRPGYNCFVSTRFTGNLTPQEYIAQQQTTATPTPTPTDGDTGGTYTTTTYLGGATGSASLPSGVTTGGGTTSSGAAAPRYIPPASTEEPSAQPTNAIQGPAWPYDWDTWKAYETYLRNLQTAQYGFWPVPKNIEDWVTNADKWLRDVENQFKTYQLSNPGATYEDWALTQTSTRTSDELFWIEGQKNYAAQILTEGSPWVTPEGEPVEWITPGGEPIQWEPGEEPAGTTTEQQHYESPHYYPAFTDWFNQQQDMSGAFRGFVEHKYPSLAAQYQYDVGHLTGFPSEEEAITSAQGREQNFQGWLTEQVPEVYQEYMGQRPYMRGERYSDYSSTLRLTNW